MPCCAKGIHVIAQSLWSSFCTPISKLAFVKALQKLVPEIQVGQLEVGGAGIRAQACDRQGNLLDDFDFRIDGNLIHVCNAPSPAATASLAIGQAVANRVLPLLL